MHLRNVKSLIDLPTVSTVPKTQLPTAFRTYSIWRHNTGRKCPGQTHSHSHHQVFNNLLVKFIGLRLTHRLMHRKDTEKQKTCFNLLVAVLHVHSLNGELSIWLPFKMWTHVNISNIQIPWIFFKQKMSVKIAG